MRLAHKNSAREKDVVVGVVMLGLLGDVLMRTPLLRETKRIFPNSRVICIADPIGAEVLRLNEHIDHLFVLDRNRMDWRRYLSGKLALMKLLFFTKFDYFFDLYGSDTFRFFATFISAKKIVFVKGLEISVRPSTSPAVSPSNSKFANPHHLTNTFLESFRYISNESISFSTKPEIHPHLVSISGRQIHALRNRFASKPLCFVSIGSGDLQKRVPLDSLVELLEHISCAHKLLPALLRNPGQEQLQADLSDCLNRQGIDHLKLETLSIEELVVVLPAARLFVVPDTGLFHLAVALDIPTLGIFTHTNPELVRPETSRCGIYFKEDLSKGKSPHFGLPYGSHYPNMPELKHLADKLIALST